MTAPFTDEPSQARRAMRLDARRNHERLLSVAREVFVEEGVNASLNEIAKQARVGSGTLYRHFPTREALLEAVLRDNFDELRVHAGEVLGQPPTSAALASWLRVVIDQVTGFPGLASSMMAVLHGGSSELASSCASVQVAGAELLARAQRFGAVRPGVGISDLLKLVIAVALATEHAPDGSGEADRLLAIVMDGVRLPG